MLSATREGRMHPSFKEEFRGHQHEGGSMERIVQKIDRREKVILREVQ